MKCEEGEDEELFDGSSRRIIEQQMETCCASSSRNTDEKQVLMTAKVKLWEEFLTKMLETR